MYNQSYKLWELKENDLDNTGKLSSNFNKNSPYYYYKKYMELSNENLCVDITSKHLAL